MKVPLSFILLAYLGISGCGLLQKSAKYAFKDGYYTYEIEGSKVRSKKQYVVVGADSIKVYDPENLKGAKVDTVKAVSIAFPSKKKPLAFKNYEFRKKSIDLDIISVILKYRPPGSGFPNQLSNTWNGAFYVGFRSDVYKLSYEKNPLKVDERTVSHFGYSLGFFTGMGTSRVDPSVTLKRLDYEYDGFIGLLGIGGFIGINRVNFGLAFGYDYLFDGNKNAWIYHEKPWLGLTVGIALQEPQKE